MNKKSATIGIAFSALLSATYVLVLLNEYANKLLAKPLDILCFPIALLLSLVFGTNDVSGIYLVLSGLYLAALGFLSGYYLHNFYRRLRGTEIPR